MCNSDKDDKEKDIWDKLNIILKPIAALLTAVTIAIISCLSTSYFSDKQKEESRFLEAKQNVEMRTMLYTELISSREAAESQLRKDMFAKIIGSFLDSGSKSLDEKLLELELLLYNFHESLVLGPLFEYLQRQIDNDTANSKLKEEYHERLRKVAKEIVEKQLATLEVAGEKRAETVDFDLLKNNPGGIELINDTLKIGLYESNFRVFVIDTDSALHEVKLILEITTPEDSSKKNDVWAEFWVGPYDFPMIDNTRMSNDERCAISLESYDYPYAVISLVFFPGSHASLKEKPYINEIIERLICKENQKL